MSTLTFEYKTQIEFSPAVAGHNILLRCLPMREAFQHVIEETFCISEGFWHNESHDGQGNRIITGGMRERHTSFCYTTSGTIAMDIYCIPDPVPHPMYRLESCLTQYDSAMQVLLPVLTGRFLDDCHSIMHRVHQHIAYVTSSTGIQTTASDVFAMRQGVCQDFAHLMIALCRHAGMSARYVCGLMTGEGQTHAWVEVHDGQCWYAFDPTNDTAVATGYIKLAHGRDALDCSVSRGIYTGISTQKSQISVIVEQQ